MKKLCPSCGDEYEDSYGFDECEGCRGEVDPEGEERTMNKQTVLDVLNSLEVIETNGGEDAYILVANSEENRAKLNVVGVSSETIRRYGDDETFCILAMAFSEGYADEYKDGKLVMWGPIDDELRYRVLNGEGTATDAERLLRALEPEVFGQ